MLSFVFLVSFTCSAVSSSPGEGYIYDSDGDFWYIPKTESADEEPTTIQSPKKRASFGASTFALTSSGSNYPDFDKNKIDIAGFPDYVQKLLSSRTSLVWLIVNDSYFYLWVADGCIPVVNSTSGKIYLMNLRLSNASVSSNTEFFYPDGASYFNTIPSDFICYYARYKWRASSDLYTTISTDWSVSDSHEFVRYSGSTASSVGSVFYVYKLLSGLYTQTTDFYVFGNANDYFRSDSTTINFGIKGGSLITKPGTWSSVVSGYNTLISNYYPSSTLRMVDGGTFPTVHSQQAEVQRGILGAIRSIPDNIRGFFTSLGDRISGFFDNLFDKIRGLFIPADGYFETYSNDLKSFFESRFGFLFELPDAVVTIFQQLVSFEPAESGYSIHFPEVKTPHINPDSGGLIWTTIISEQDFTFDFLNDSPFSTLYSGYRAFVWLAYCVMLINLAKSKADKVLGG